MSLFMVYCTTTCLNEEDRYSHTVHFSVKCNDYSWEGNRVSFIKGLNSGVVSMQFVRGVLLYICCTEERKHPVHACSYVVVVYLYLTICMSSLRANVP